MDWYRWKPYVPVAKRRQKAQKKMESLRKRGADIQPVEINGRAIAKTFWGKAWCDHLESFSDFSNRLPRGRTYVRNGSVCHLAIRKGKVEAKVSGSDIYNIQVRIKTLPAKQWSAVKRQCSGGIGSLLELLRGDLSDNIMQVVTDRQTGLFPHPGQISFDCDCPDWAVMCKHVAAVMYGVGARLDQDPALLFLLRGVKQDELIDVDAQVAVPAGTRRGGAKRLASNDLGDVFGIDLATDEPDESSNRTVKAKRKGKRKAKRKVKQTSATKKMPSARAASSVKKKTPSKRSAKKGTKKAAVHKKKVAKIAKKTTARKPVKKKPVKKKPVKKKPVKKKPVKKKPVKKKPVKKKAVKKQAVKKKAVKKKAVKKKAVKKKAVKKKGNLPKHGSRLAKNNL